MARVLVALYRWLERRPSIREYRRVEWEKAVRESVDRSFSTLRRHRRLSLDQAKRLQEELRKPDDPPAAAV